MGWIVAFLVLALLGVVTLATGMALNKSKIVIESFCKMCGFSDAETKQTLRSCWLIRK